MLYFYDTIDLRKSKVIKVGMEIDINQAAKKPVSDDPELAKVLAGVNSAVSTDDNSSDENQDADLQFEGLESLQVEPAEVQEAPVVEQIPVAPAPITSFGGLDLDGIKSHALEDLRPLVEKLTVSNEEKFDIYLLLLRSSDDNTLIEPAYEAARNIEDETKRANALLDVIKEIDYFKSKHVA